MNYIGLFVNQNGIYRLRRLCLALHMCNAK
jgi:hypothetical protein